MPRCGISAQARAQIARKTSATNSPARSKSPHGRTPLSAPLEKKSTAVSSSAAASAAAASDLLAESGPSLLNTAGLGAAVASSTTQQQQHGVKRSTFELEFDALRTHDRLNDEDCIGPKGFAQLCKELGFPTANSREGFIVAQRLGCAQFGFVTRGEWSNAARGELHLGTLALTAKGWVVDSADPIIFREVYYNAFDMVRSDNSNTGLKLDAAVRLWQLLLTTDIFPLVNVFCVWALQEFKRPVTRDLYKEVWRFAQSQVGLDDYDSNGTWPCAIDDFVDWSRRRAAASKQKAAAAALAAAN